MTANIILGSVALLASLWIGNESQAYRTAFSAVLVGVFSLYGARALGDVVFVHVVDSQRLSIFFKHANHLGNVLSFALIFCFSVAAIKSGRRFHVLIWIPTVLMSIALVHTQSRGAWLGGMVGMTASIMHLRGRVSAKRLCLSTLLVAIVIAAAAANISPGQVAKRFSGDSPDVVYSAGNRVLPWRSTLGIIRTHWLVGVGIASLGDALKSDSSVRFRNNGRFSSAMNNYLNLAAEAGVPVLVFYLVLIAYACVHARRVVARSGSVVGMNVGLLCGVYSMLVFGLTTYTLSRVYASVLMWSALGFVISQGSDVLAVSTGRALTPTAKHTDWEK